KKKKTYNTEDSPVVTHLSTSSALSCLKRGERTGSRIFSWIWSYVKETGESRFDIFKTFGVFQMALKINKGGLGSSATVLNSDPELALAHRLSRRPGTLIAIRSPNDTTSHSSYAHHRFR
ncbi:hypothetical protein B0T21DRAFT_292040, partial [Apiosordaria backusii]